MIISKRIFKYLLSFVLLFSLVICFTFKEDVEAAGVYDNAHLSSFTANETVSEDLYGVHHEIVTGTTVTGGQSFGQYINEFEIKTDGVTSKLVTWSVQSTQTHFSKVAITKAAKDYEAKHPGWIVVGGINADQYWMSFGKDMFDHGTAVYQPAPCYPMIMDGEKLFTITEANNISVNSIGFKNDGSAEGFVESEGYGGLELSIIDENNKAISKFTIDAINESVSNGTSVWMSPFDGTSSATQYNVVPVTASSSNQKFIVESAELCYVSNSPTYGYTQFVAETALFGRGSITIATTDSVTFEYAQFGIETTNQEIIDALAVGKRIRVEQIFKNEEMNECENAVGYHAAHKIDNVEQEDDQPYDLQNYSRSLFGMKADGTYVLITADMVQNYVPGKTSCGLRFSECNAVANYYGVTDMYQMDGGGSTTAMVRQKDGTFKVTNYPKDSKNPESPRSDFSYLFFVVRDSGVKVDTTSTTYHSITLKNTIESADITSFNVLVNGQKYSYYDGIVIDGLNEETTYDITYQYEITTPNGVYKNEYTVKETTTRYERPANPIKMISANKNSLTFNVRDDLEVQISNIKIYLYDQMYEMGNPAKFTIDDLLENQDYEFYATYKVYDEVTGNYYEGKTRTYTVKTLDYLLPEIIKFKEYKKDANFIQFEYGYTDDDGVVLDAYVQYGDTKVSFDRESGKQKIEGLDFVNNDYTFQMVVEYIDGKIKSEELKYTHTGKQDNQDENPDVNPTPTPENETKKKCGKKSSQFVISLISITTLLALILRKKH